MTMKTKDTLKVFAIWAGVLLAVFAVGWLILANTAAMGRVFSPIFEQTRRETFETSKAYRDGMAQELRALQIEYIKADAQLKPALARVILHKAAGVPEDALPSDVRAFVASIQPRQSF
jgi:hypothetical protein